MLRLSRAKLLELLLYPENPSFAALARATRDVRQFQLVDESEYSVVGCMGIVHGKVPIDGVFQFGFIDRMGYPGHFSATDSAPYADQPSVEGFGGWPTTVMALLPVLELVQKAAVTVNGREHFQQRHIVSLGEIIL